MRITQKLGILVAVPLCAVSGFGTLALVTSASGAIKAGHLWHLMDTAHAAGTLVARLQDERTAVTASMMGLPGGSAGTSLDDQTARTDAAAAVFRDKAARLIHVPKDTGDVLDRIHSELAALPALRAEIRSGSAPALSAVIFQYRIAVADLLAFQGDIAQAGGAPADIADRIHSASYLAQASESTSQEEVEVLRLAIGTPLTPNAQQDITVARTGYFQGLETFAATAGPDWRARPAQALAGPAVAEAGRLEDLVARTPVGGRVRFDPSEWIAAMSAREDALDGVRAQLDLENLAAIAAERHDQRLLAGIEAASVAATVLVALVLSLRLGRPMIRGLRQLQDSAHAVAYEHLPAAVDALRVDGALRDQTPEEFADRVGPAVQVSGDDEIAAVGRAFNAVHREAVRTAADMELLRAGVGAAFVALARRGERLTGALTSELDKAERDEDDPDRLARLFVLDHLAARMSRNNESLLVLGGEGTARVRDHGLPLLDVIRAAMGRVERYSRVDIGAVDPSITVAPGVVDHLVHLCAELIDNATAFSSPDSRVWVGASVLADRIILQIADDGIGLTPKQRDELNARLSAPHTADITAVRAMGLTVSARLAAWHGLVVELRPRPGGGTIAEIELPSSQYWGVGRQPDAADGTPAAVPAVAAPAPAGPPDVHPASDLQAQAPGYPPAGEPVPAFAAPAPPASATPVSGTSVPPWPASPETPPTALLPAGDPVEPAAPDGGPRARPPGPAATTLHGLPKRVPLARLPVDADDEPETPDAEDVRDSSQVSSILAAYGRGIGSHGSDTSDITPTPPRPHQGTAR